MCKTGFIKRGCFLLMLLLLLCLCACGAEPSETLPREPIATVTTEAAIETPTATEETVAETPAATEEAVTAPVTEEAAQSHPMVSEEVPAGDAADYILNLNTKKFHYPDCDSVGQMNEENKKPFTGSREQVIAMGYDPCGNCHP